MGKVGEIRHSRLAEAVRCWTGRGEGPMPARSDARLLDRFGAEEGPDLLEQVKALEDEFYLSDAYLQASDIQDMARRSAKDFESRRPEVDRDIVDTFVWCYTFDYK